MAESRWQDIFLHLKKSGFEVYPPAMKQDECASPYLVVKNDGSSKKVGISTDEDLYQVMVYVPQLKYSQLEVKVQQVKRAMKGLEPMIKPYGMQTPSYFDEKVKAHMVGITYKNYKKI